MGDGKSHARPRIDQGPGGTETRKATRPAPPPGARLIERDVTVQYAAAHNHTRVSTRGPPQEEGEVGSIWFALEAFVNVRFFI